jgi:methanogenic corrinoid protein MtbC1
MKEHLSPKQLGQAIGVSEASVKRWCDKGKIAFFRTEGGHRKLPINSVIQYLRQHHIVLVRPEILGLPPRTGLGARQVPKVKDLLRDALEQGNGEQFRRLAFNLYLDGQSCVDIFDLFIAEVFHELGTRWQHGDIEIYQERRACEICLGFLHELRSLLPRPPQNSPRAMGATLKVDAYTLASTMVELSLREAGWDAQSLGTGLPAETICAALQKEKPRLFWLSVSHCASESAFLEEYKKIYDTARDLDIAVAVGGRALHEELRRKMSFSVHCDQLRHLVAFASTLKSN